jgi:hypothetical protein
MLLLPTGKELLTTLRVARNRFNPDVKIFAVVNLTTLSMLPTDSPFMKDQKMLKNRH